MKVKPELMPSRSVSCSNMDVKSDNYRNKNHVPAPPMQKRKA